MQLEDISCESETAHKPYQWYEMRVETAAWLCIRQFIYTDINSSSVLHFAINSKRQKFMRNTGSIIPNLYANKKGTSAVVPFDCVVGQTTLRSQRNEGNIDLWCNDDLHQARWARAVIILHYHPQPEHELPANPSGSWNTKQHLHPCIINLARNSIMAQEKSIS